VIVGVEVFVVFELFFGDVLVELFEFSELVFIMLDLSEEEEANAFFVE
jgi:hypothetical protein